MYLESEYFTLTLLGGDLRVFHAAQNNRKKIGNTFLSNLILVIVATFRISHDHLKDKTRVFSDFD